MVACLPTRKFYCINTVRYNLQKGFKSNNGQVEIVNEDNLCFIVRNISKGASGLRTISKALLYEYVEYFETRKNPTSVSAREDLSGTSEIDKFEYGYTSTLSTMAKMVLGEELSDHDKVLAGKIKTGIDVIELPLQIIFYGAPGTGKSHKIDNDPHVTDENTIRTTFHPDSDYSTFVGAYKPTMAPMPVNAFVGTTVHHAKNADNEKAYEKKIVYKYVTQAFLKAYVAAWSDLDNPHFLVIEEINRGNCAQIFGDLFQLLDHNNMGSSSYAIHADEDITQFLAEDKNGFANLSEEQKYAIRSFVLVKDSGKTEAIGDAILSGKKLLLPPNLYIWATMNTSDQSLFPIDSAFKRRWNWEYIPISYAPTDKKTGRPLNWAFEVGGKLYSWGKFLEAINPLILSLTDSTDKQMGYFFAKPDKKSDPAQERNDVISEKIFLNKVLFYIWTDALKDYDITREEFKKPDGKRLEFTDFFEYEKDYNSLFVSNLKVNEIGEMTEAEPTNAEEEKQSHRPYKTLAVTFPDGRTIKEDTIIGSYLATLEAIGIDRAAAAAQTAKYRRRNHPLISAYPVQELLDHGYTYAELGGYHILKGIKNISMSGLLKAISDTLNLSLTVTLE